MFRSLLGLFPKDCDEIDAEVNAFFEPDSEISSSSVEQESVNTPSAPRKPGVYSKRNDAVGALGIKIYTYFGELGRKGHVCADRLKVLESCLSVDMRDMMQGGMSSAFWWGSALSQGILDEIHALVATPLDKVISLLDKFDVQGYQSKVSRLAIELAAVDGSKHQEGVKIIHQQLLTLQLKHIAEMWRLMEEIDDILEEGAATGLNASTLGHGFGVFQLMAPSVGNVDKIPKGFDQGKVTKIDFKIEELIKTFNENYRFVIDKIPGCELNRESSQLSSSMSMSVR